MLRYAALILIIVLIALQVKLWTGQGGLHAMWRLRERVVEQRDENDKLRERNETLSAEVEDLKHGDEAIEERARSELGLVKPGETFYQIVEPASEKDADGDDSR